MTVIFAGQQLQWSTQSDLHMAAAHTVSSVAANAANFFTHSGGIQAIAEEPLNISRLFMHEMVHVWQHQLKYPVKWRGALRIGLDYHYELTETSRLSDFNMEAQGDLLSDYLVYKLVGKDATDKHGKKFVHSLSVYEKVLRNFIGNQSDPTNLPGRGVDEPKSAAK